MKLLVVVLSDQDCEPVMEGLIESSFRVTRVASTGGFLRRGNTTLFIGTEDERVEEAIHLVRDRACDPRVTGQRRATLFSLNVEHFEQF